MAISLAVEDCAFVEFAGENISIKINTVAVKNAFTTVAGDLKVAVSGNFLRV